MPDYQPNAIGPLHGVRVLDLSRLVAGNILTGFLADFGADVVKVEPSSGGDTLRAWQTEGISTSWKVYSRNKRSLALDFRHSRTHDLLLSLAKSANVFIESFRPGTLEEMDLAPATLLAANPKLVIVRVSGWGQDGPYRRRPGFGTLIEGMSGFAAMNGFPDREPLLPPTHLADSIAGMHGAAAVLVALREVETNGGNGQVIDLALAEPLFSVLGAHAADYGITGATKERMGNRLANTAPRNVFRTKDDRWVCLSGSTQGMAMRILDSIGRPELKDDPRFATNTGRLANVEALDKVIGDFIATRTQAENIAFFDAAEVTVGPIYDIADILEDPHFQARGLVQDYPDADAGTIAQHAVLPRLSSTPGAIRKPAPALGADTRAVLADYGVEPGEIESLVSEGVVAAG